MALTNVSERIRESCRGLALCRVPGDCVGLALAPCRVPGGLQLPAPQRRRNRQGVALIMVVGLLALMMVMAVAFAIFMRTERVAAGSFRTDVRARNLLQVALSRAVYAIDTNMSAAGLSYPGWEALYSGGGSVYVREALTKDALEQIPLGALTPSGTCLGGGNDNVVVDKSVPGGGKGAIINLTDHSFGLITNVVDLGGGNSKVFHTKLTGGQNNTWAAGVDTYYFLQPVLVDLPATSGGGRYGYVVINCSGLPDANYVGGVARSIGTNVTEIQISAIPGGVNPATLVTERSTPFETHQELVGRGMASGAFTDYPDYYVCYSSAVTNDGKYYIGGTAEDLYNGQDIILGILTNLTCKDSATPIKSLTAVQARILITNLIDYVDATRIPGDMNGHAPCNPSGPCVEAFPMANEVLISNVIYCAYDVATSNYTVSGTLNCYAEFVNPFKGLISADKNNYTLGFCVITSGTAAAQYYPTAGSLVNETLVNNWNASSVGGEYCVKTLSASIPATIMSDLSFTNNPLKSYGVSLWVRNPDGVVVDLVTNPVVPVGPFNWTVQVFANKDVRLSYLGNSECVDPRLNFDANSAANQWYSPSYSGCEQFNTLGTTNFRAIYFWNKDPANPILGPAGNLANARDGDTAMYVPRLGTNIKAVGELGYLFYGDKWETVRLFRRGGLNNFGQVHPVIDHFTVTDLSSGIPKGRVNPNTANSDVLNAVYSKLPYLKPHGGATSITPSQLDAIVAAIIGRTSTNALGSLAGLGSIRWDLIDLSWNSLDQESVVRNSSGLLDPRQNFFTILLYADVTKMDIAGNSTAMSSIMGVAEVWRDPGTNTFPVNVRSLQIMEAQ